MNSRDLEEDGIVLGKRGDYGGIWTDVSTLQVGTKFWIDNGGWTGEIIEIDGVKHLGGDCTPFALTGSYYLQISKTDK